MSTFNLPDLGEGLAEAVIHEWHVAVGDQIKTDQIMLSVETAKALVDIPSPFNGKVLTLFAKAGETIKTGAPLLEVETDTKIGTVAGKLETSDIILAPEKHTQAKTISSWLSEAKPISGIRLSMARNMRRAHAEVVNANIFDEADVSGWPEKTDVTVRLIQALCQACKEIPELNAWYDGQKQLRLLHSNIHLGLAMDTPQGLVVPVIKNAEQKTAIELREIINHYKTELQKGHLSPDIFQGATISLSNIGNFAGQYATPIVLPPTVAIVAVGKTHAKNRTIPLSLGFDHRVVTGGEGARFLGAMIKSIAIEAISK